MHVYLYTLYTNSRHNATFFGKDFAADYNFFQNLQLIGEFWAFRTALKNIVSQLLAFIFRTLSKCTKNCGYKKTTASAMFFLLK